MTIPKIIDGVAGSRLLSDKSVAKADKARFAEIAKEVRAIAEEQQRTGVSTDEQLGATARLSAEAETILARNVSALTPSRDQIRREFARREMKRRKGRASVLGLAKALNPLYKPAPFHKALAKVLTDWAHHKVRRVIVQMPPQHGKSELVSRTLPPFIFGHNPDAQIISACHTARLSRDFSREVQRRMDEDEYTKMFPRSRLYSPKSRPLAGGQVVLRSADEFRIVGASGRYFASGVDGGVSGRSSTHTIIDDPYKGVKEARSAAYRDMLEAWFESEIRTRQAPNASILVCMTRWHHKDLVSYLLKDAQAGGEPWTVVSFEAQKEGPPTIHDPRAVGAYLWSERYPDSYYEQAKRNRSVWLSLYQQNPKPADGLTFDERTFGRTFDELPSAPFERLILSLDANSKKTRAGSFACIQVWGELAGEFWLLDQSRGRWSYPQLKREFRAVCETYPELSKKLVEAAANGLPLCEELDTLGIAYTAVKATVSKVIRAESVVDYFEEGRIRLPSPSFVTRRGRSASWIVDTLKEWGDFPTSATNDTVDTMSQALRYLAKPASPILFGRA